MNNKQREQKKSEQLEKLNRLLINEDYDEVKVMCEELIEYWKEFNDIDMIDYFENQLEIVNDLK